MSSLARGQNPKANLSPFGLLLGQQKPKGFSIFYGFQGFLHFAQDMTIGHFYP
jgi:hypothetical protein